VRFELLSVDCISEFLDVLHLISADLNLSIWKNIVRGFRPDLPSDADRTDPGRYFAPARLTFEFEQSLPFNGIIAGLSRKAGKNPHDAGLIRVTAHTTRTSTATDAPQNVLDHDSPSAYWSADKPFPWICFDFRQMRVRPTHYSIRSQTYQVTGGNNLKNWVVDGSDDGVFWTELDRELGNAALNTGRVASFPLNAANRFRYLRLRLIGKNWAGNNILRLCAIEFFGSLQSPPHCTFEDTGTGYFEQPWWGCQTCGLVGGLGCCSSCATKCHAGHDTFLRGNMTAYCDCGSIHGHCCKFLPDRSPERPRPSPGDAPDPFS
jgi:hypothetical protein